MNGNFYYFTPFVFCCRSFKCVSCEKHFNSKIELKSHNKIHETLIWNASEINNVPENSMLSSEVQPIENGHPPLNNIVIDPDSAVSEKVLLDTVAEKEVMDRVEVSLL